MAEEETVLVLASNLFFMPRIEAAAEASGLNMVTASTAAALLDALGTYSVPLVLIDLEMDETVWAEALESLNAIEMPRARVVAYGPHGEPETLRKARDLGSDAVLIKRDFSEGLPDLLASRGESASG